MKRREFIAFYGLAGLSLMFSATPRIGLDWNLTPPTAPNIVPLLKAWRQAEPLSPKRYLALAGISDTLNQSELKTRISQEFRNGDIAELNGFIMSKLELALLIEFGSHS